MRKSSRIPLDEALRVDMDTGFMGVNDRLDPSLLRSGQAYYQLNQELMQPGIVAEALNMRFSRGQAETRPGCITPVHFNPGFEGIAGAGIYSDPDGREWMAVVEQARVWMLADCVTPREIAAPAGQFITDAVEVVQAFKNLILFRGKDADPWQWNGDFNRPFYPVTDPPPDLTDPERPRYLSPVPRAEFGVVAGDRLWVPYGRDGVAWSDALEYNAFDLTLNTARLNAGEDDSIVAMMPYESGILVWKDQSIFRMNGVIGDPSQTLTAERIHRGLGCLARKSVAQVGSEIFWLAHGGVYSLSQSFEARMAAAAMPVSEAIGRTMDRINWRAAGRACAIVHDRYYLLAVPIDGSETNNATLVYDTTTRMWQGVDMLGAEPADLSGLSAEDSESPVFLLDPFYGPALSVSGPGRPALQTAAQCLLRTDLFGRKCAFLVDQSRVIALGQGKSDIVGGGDYHIFSRVVTRGYVLGELGIKKLRALGLNFGTWDAEIRVTAITEGINEERLLLDWRGRDRAAHTGHGMPRWNPENVHDDFHAPRREDYAWVAGDGTRLKRSGLSTFLPQDYYQGWPLRLESRWVAFRIESRRGFLSVKTVSADGLGERNVLSQRS